MSTDTRASATDQRPYNLATAFVDRHLAERRGDKVAIRCGDGRSTYRHLAELTNRVGHGLQRLGLHQEERVLLVLPDGPEFAAAYFGTMKIGAVAVPTSTSLRAADYAYALAESRARVVIVHGSAWGEVAAALARQAHTPHVVGCGGDAGLAWEEWLHDCPDQLEAVATTRDDVAFWLWTSGSTGRPKAAVHLHGDWAVCCEHYACGVLGLGPDDVTFSSSKLFHAYGLGNGLMFPLHVGATSVLFPGKPQPHVVLETARDQRPTVLFSVPTLYAAMLQQAERTSYDLGSVRLAVSAAEPLPAAVYVRWQERFGIEILDGIGSTEVLHIYISSRQGHVKPGSSGQVVPGYQVRIVDGDGNDVPPGVIGDLLVAGESTALGYWRRRAMTADRMRGRWFFTGDKYSVDADGFYWYAGRSDDMFKVSGQWVSPNAVENCLLEHPAVLEAAVVAYVEESSLHTPKAFVVLRQQFEPSSELVAAIQQFVKGRIEPHQYPRRIVFVPDLPKNAAGKILRHELRAAEAAQAAADRRAPEPDK